MLNYANLNELTKDLTKEHLHFISEFWSKSNDMLDDWRSILLNIGNFLLIIQGDSTFSTEGNYFALMQIIFFRKTVWLSY